MANNANKSKDWEDLLSRCDAMVKAAKERIDVQSAMEVVYNLQWDEEALRAKPPWVMDTLDPQPADTIDWVCNSLSNGSVNIEIKIPEDALSEASNPQPTEDEIVEDLQSEKAQSIAQRFMGFANNLLGRASPPSEPEESPARKIAKDLGETMEVVARSILAQNDKRRRNSLQRQIIKDGALKDQIVVKVADLRLTKLWRGEEPSLQGQSPFVFVPIDPRTIYTEWDDLGICAALQRDVRSLRNVKSVYGKVAKLDGSDGLSDANGNVVFCEWWTRDEKATWIEKTLEGSAQKPDLNSDVKKLAVIEDIRPNPLGFIPIILKNCRGDGEKVRPLLFNGWKSKIFRAADVFLTMVTTSGFKTSVDQWVQTGVGASEDAIQLDFSAPHVYPLRSGQDIKPLSIPPEEKAFRAMEVVLNKEEMTTASRAIAGFNTGAIAASAINLQVHDSEKVLGPILAAAEECYSAIVHMVFDYVRTYAEIRQDVEASGVELWTDDGTQRVDPTQLPKWFECKCTIKADTPQDKIALVNMAIQARALKPPLVSQKTAWGWIGIEDMNAEEERLQAEQDKVMAPQIAAQLAQQPPPGGMPALPAPMPPSQAMAQPVPIDQNPQVQNQTEGLVNAMMNANKQPPGM